MKATASPHIARLSAKGQFTIPKRLRDSIGVRPGERAALEMCRGHLTISALRPTITEQTAGSLARHARPRKEGRA